MKHSPDPWTYDTGTYKVYDAEGEEVATVYGYDDDDTHANGHRIAALSAENARMREVLEEIEADAGNLGAKPDSMLARIFDRARTALRAGGAEKGVGT